MGNSLGDMELIPSGHHGWTLGYKPEVRFELPNNQQRGTLLDPLELGSLSSAVKRQPDIISIQWLTEIKNPNVS
jgi:hypothetical protein